MRALYDSEAHAMYIHLVDPPYEGPAGADDAGYPVLVEFDPDDRIVGVQILSADDHPDAAVVTALERFGLDVVGILAARDLRDCANPGHAPPGPASPGPSPCDM